MNEQQLARNTLARLRQAESSTLDFSALTDAELDAYIDGTATPAILAKVRRVSGRRDNLLSYLTDEELDRIIAGLPPDPSQAVGYHE